MFIQENRASPRGGPQKEWAGRRGSATCPDRLDTYTGRPLCPFPECSDSRVVSSQRLAQMQQSTPNMPGLGSAGCQGSRDASNAKASGKAPCGSRFGQRSHSSVPDCRQVNHPSSSRCDQIIRATRPPSDTMRSGSSATKTPSSTCGRPSVMTIRTACPLV